MTAARDMMCDVECACSRCGNVLSVEELRGYGIGREMYCADCLEEEESEAEDDECPKCGGGFCRVCTGVRFTGVF